ncbi:MAG TPA: EF-hand domain-containing protein [Burkholderiales bacterium]|nr:EF-hand domain-containing protein [Burkholderiales bacterium]
MRKLWLLVALSLALPVAAEEALGTLPVRVRDAAFAVLDADGDGFISRVEASKHAGVAAGLRAADADGDGRLSPPEFSRIPLNRSDHPGPYRTASRA